MTRRSRVFAWIGGVIVVLIAGIVIFLATFNWNQARPFIDNKVSQAIGRPFAIRGNLSVHWRTDRAHGDWLPGPVFTANDIAVGNPAWARHKNLAHLDRISFRVSLWPLLWHHIVVQTLQLQHPAIHLEKMSKTRNDWSFKVQSGGGSSWHMDLHEIVFDKGTITLDDPPDRLHADVEIDPLGKPIPFSRLMRKAATSKAGKAVATQPTHDYAFGFKVTGSYHGAPVHGSGKTGGVLAMQSADTAFPLQADLHMADLHIALTGSIINPAAMGSIDLHLRLAGNDMAHLYPLTGVILPDTPPFETDGHLTGQFKPRASHFTYRDFNGRVGGSDLHGTLTFTQHAPRPKLSGKVWSDKLQFADLGPLIGVRTQAGKSGANRNTATTRKKNKPLPPDAKVLPHQPFSTDRWKTMDANVHFKGKQILHGKSLPIHHLKAHLTLKDGALALAPLDLAVAGGTLKSAIYLDGRAQPMKGRIDMHVRHVKLRRLFPDIKSMRKALGEINGDIALSATGNSVAVLLASSNGEVKLVMDNGVISRALMELAGLNVGTYVVDKLFGSKPTKITCAATDLVAHDGLMKTRLGIFDTTNALIEIKGTVNFADETVDLNIVPHTKGLRIFSLRSPLYVKGTFAHPDVGVHVGKLLLRGGGALVLGVFATPAAALLPLIAPSKDRSANPCGKLFSKMRGGAQAPPAGQPSH